MTAAVVVVEFDGGCGQRQGLRQNGVGRIAIAVQDHVREGAIGAGEGIVRIEIHRLLKQFDGAPVVVWAIAAQVLDAAQDAFVRRQRRLAPALLQQRVLDATVQCRNDRARDLVGNGQDVGQARSHRLRPTAAPDCRRR